MAALSILSRQVSSVAEFGKGVPKVVVTGNHIHHAGMRLHGDQEGQVQLQGRRGKKKQLMC